MKKPKAIKSDLLAYIQNLIPRNLSVIDAFVENSHLVAVLNNGLHIKIKQ